MRARRHIALDCIHEMLLWQGNNLDLLETE